MNTIKEKIMAIPNPYDDFDYDGRHYMLVGYERGMADSAEVAQEYVNKLELAQKFNLEAVQESCAGLAMLSLNERAKMEALIAELREVCFDEQSGGYFHRLDIGGAEISEVLDKWSTK